MSYSPTEIADATKNFRVKMRILHISLLMELF